MDWAGKAILSFKILTEYYFVEFVYYFVLEII